MALAPLERPDGSLASHKTPSYFLLTPYLLPTQIATAATFSAAWLEGLRMALALLERPDGSLASPFAGDPVVVLPTLAALLPAALPAAAAGAPQPSSSVLQPHSIPGSVLQTCLWCFPFESHVSSCPWSPCL